MILAKSLEKSALKEQIGAGIILTGGMTKLKGIRELAQSIFTAMTVRIAKPKEEEGLFEEMKDPAFSTAVGLLLYRAGKHTQYEINFNQEMLHSKSVHTDDLGDLKLNNPEYTQQTVAEKEETETKESKEEEPSTITFDDLPDIGKENSNPIKKIANWAKQLF
jgi:cell division protein FtsA